MVTPEAPPHLPKPPTASGSAPTPGASSPSSSPAKLAVLAVVYLGAYMLQPEAVYPHNYEDAPGPSWHAFKNALHGWDTVHYVTLAEDGYEKGSFRNAFYPVLPYSIRALNVVTGDSIVSGLIVANLASGAGLYLLYVFVRRRYSAQAALTTLALLLAFPTAFYLDIVYSEGPFLLLTAALLPRPAVAQPAPSSPSAPSSCR